MNFSFTAGHRISLFQATYTSHESVITHAFTEKQSVFKCLVKSENFMKDVCKFKASDVPFHWIILLCCSLMKIINQFFRRICNCRKCRKTMQFLFLNFLILHVIPGRIVSGSKPSMSKILRKCRKAVEKSQKDFVC